MLCAHLCLHPWASVALVPLVKPNGQASAALKGPISRSQQH